VPGREKRSKEEERRPLNFPLPNVSADQPQFPQPHPNLIHPEFLRIPPMRPFFPHHLFHPMDMGMLQNPSVRSPLMPPVTVMVPYPVPLPIPIPIPIVLPLFGPPLKSEDPPAGPSLSPKNDELKEKEPPESEPRSCRKKKKIA